LTFVRSGATVNLFRSRFSQSIGTNAALSTYSKIDGRECGNVAWTRGTHGPRVASRFTPSTRNFARIMGHPLPAPLPRWSHSCTCDSINYCRAYRARLRAAFPTPSFESFISKYLEISYLAPEPRINVYLYRYLYCFSILFPPIPRKRPDPCHVFLVAS